MQFEKYKWCKVDKNEKTVRNEIFFFYKLQLHSEA